MYWQPWQFIKHVFCFIEYLGSGKCCLYGLLLYGYCSFSWPIHASFSCNVLPDSIKKELFQRSFSNKSFPRFLPDKMAVEKRLAYSIVQFLRDQTHCGSLNSDEQESLDGRSPSCLKHLKSQAFFTLGLAVQILLTLSDERTENHHSKLLNLHV